MNILIVSALLLFAAALIEVDGQDMTCIKLGRIRNGKDVTCTFGEDARRMPHLGMCTYKCKDQYKNEGTETVYCFNGQIYDKNKLKKAEDLVPANFYKQPKCVIDPDVSVDDDDVSMRSNGMRSIGGGMRSIEEEPVVQETCAAQKCHRSFTGQTKSQCELAQCCWNGETGQCHAKQCSPGRNYRGVSKNKCLKGGRRGEPACLYNSKTSECYQAPSVQKQNIVKTPKSSHWSADLFAGTTDSKTEYKVSSSMTSFSRRAGAEAQVKELANVAKPLTLEDSFWSRFREEACHYGGVVEVNTEGKKEVNITLAYNDDWDLFHTFSLANTASKAPTDMLFSVFSPTAYIQIMGPSLNVAKQIPRTRDPARPNFALNSGLDTIKLHLSRSSSALKYSVKLWKGSVEDSLQISDLWNGQERLYLYINRSSNLPSTLKKTTSDARRGFGLCSVTVDAS